MYIVIGVRADGREAVLRYQTLDEALQKIRDLAEADEIDSDGPMFVRYALELAAPPLAAPPLAPHTDAAAPRAPQRERSTWDRLRLRRDEDEE